MGFTFQDNEVLGQHTVRQTSLPITIGNGVTSFGTFNATQETVTHNIWDRNYLGSQSLRDWDAVVDNNGVIHMVYIDNLSVGTIDNTGKVLKYIKSTDLTPVVLYTASFIVSYGIPCLSMCLGTEAIPWLHIVFADRAAVGDPVYYLARRTDAGTADGLEQVCSQSGATALFTGAPASGAQPYGDISVAIGTDNIPYIAFNSTCVLSASAPFTTYGIKMYRRNVGMGLTYSAGTWSGVNINSHTTQYLKRRSQVVISGSTPFVVSEYNGETDGIYVYNNTGVLLCTVATGITRMFRKSAAALPNGRIGIVYKVYGGAATYVELASPYTSIAYSYTFSLSDIPADVKEPNFNLKYDSSSKAHISMQYPNETNKDALYYFTNASGSWIRTLIDASADNYEGEYAPTSQPLNQAGTAFKQATMLYYNKPIILYHDNIAQGTGVPKFVKTTPITTTVREYKISTAINNALQSLPSNGGTITILEGTYYLDSGVNINTSGTRLKGVGNNTNIRINAATAKISVGTVATTNVRIDLMKLTSINAIPYTTNAQDAPMLELVATNATNCFVKNVTFIGYGGNAADKDMKHTIADGHIVDDNISSTGVAGLGGI